ncbi:hypothetical protein AUP68_16017 [Ilyonectria robusta]
MRAQFGILIPNTDTCTQDLHLHTTDPETPPFLGTVIHVIGAPMAGFHLEFKRNFDANRDQELKEVILVGSINGIHVADPPFTNFSREDKPICTVEAVATQIPPPRKSENFLAPVNDATNRRCQEWTMDFVRRLVELEYVPSEAVQIVQSHRDPPEFGIDLRPLNQED